MIDVQGVVSVTIVGSFNDRDDSLMISDIDTIVICDQLNEELFRECIRAVEMINGNSIGFPDRKVFVNSTFGPLKFDRDDRVVVHLMIYDREGHRQHVLKSPFTCYDWERSTLRVGPSLESIYPVLKLQAHDFLNARRGLKNYLEDLEKGVISYREYEFKDREVCEILASKILDPKHCGEYAYHIIKNLVVNFCKFIEQDNAFLKSDDFYQKWQDYLPECAYYIPKFREIAEIKINRGALYPKDTLEEVKTFIQKFENQLVTTFNRATHIHFYRHGKTYLNDGSFLGQGRDPELLKLEVPEEEGMNYTKVFASPMKRAYQTAMLLVSQTIEKDSRLNEINYGKAEGLFYEDLKREYPNVVDAWSKGEDPNFPDGENTNDVLERIKSFLDSMSREHGNVLAVSHNIVLRCLVGHLLGLDLKYWYQLNIPHLEKLSVMILNQRAYLNLLSEVKSHLVDGVVLEDA